MHLKLMGQTAGEFRMIEIVDCSFHRLPEPHVKYWTASPSAVEQYLALEGSVFLLNADGKTVDTFHPYPQLRQTDRK